MRFKEPMLCAPLLKPEVEHTDDNILGKMKELRYPVLASLKLDGIRALRLNGTLLSRKFKPIPNAYIRSRSIFLPAGMDMELYSKLYDYNQIQSIVMSASHPLERDICYHLLDWYNTQHAYEQRIHDIMVYMQEHAHLEAVTSCTKFGPPIRCDNAEQLFTFFRSVEENLGEGICFRTPNSPYKFGRSTLAQQWLVKLCRYVTSEAIITGFEEQLANCNDDKRDATGKMKRSHSIDGLYGKGTLGALAVRDVHTNIEFSVGGGLGLDDRLRQEIWNNQHQYLGKVISYRCKAHGVKVKPRSPQFRGFRNAEID